MASQPARRGYFFDPREFGWIAWVSRSPSVFVIEAAESTLFLEEILETPRGFGERRLRMVPDASFQRMGGRRGPARRHGERERAPRLARSVSGGTRAQVRWANLGLRRRAASCAISACVGRSKRRGCRIASRAFRSTSGARSISRPASPPRRGDRRRGARPRGPLRIPEPESVFPLPLDDEERPTDCPCQLRLLLRELEALCQLCGNLHPVRELEPHSPLAGVVERVHHVD